MSPYFELCISELGVGNIDGDKTLVYPSERYCIVAIPRPATINIIGKMTSIIKVLGSLI